MAASRKGSWILLIVIVGLACRAGESSTPDTKPPPANSAAAPAADSHAKLAALDTRTPVPLVPMMANHQKQNMRDHLVVVQEIVASFASKDFAAIEKAASRIGYSEQMGAMCSHMGAGAAGFTEAALAFHHTADSISDAAKKKDAAAVLTALNATLTTCTSCHAKYRQEVVDDTTWASLTNEAAPTGATHH